MKFVALVSGGKDSIYSIVECVKLGHELVACLHLGRPDSQEEQEESFMYQSAASESIETLVCECLQVPLVLYKRRGSSIDTSLVYTETNDNDDDDNNNDNKDEVEDLYNGLVVCQERFPEIEGVAVGAILSTYQRVRVENVCSRLQLTPLSFLWRRASQHDLLRDMIDHGIVAVLVRVAAPPGLVPRRHLNKTLQELQDHFCTLYDKYQFHVCGEGGEYETLCLDSPVHKKKLVIDEYKIADHDDGTGELWIQACHAQEKDEDDTPILSYNSALHTAVSGTATRASTAPSQAASAPSVFPTTQSVRILPYVRELPGGLLHCSEIMSSRIVPPSEQSSEVELAVQEAVEVLEIMATMLRRHGCTPQDVLMVHLYLSEMSHFAHINRHYKRMFGVMLPPSRSCVALGNTLSGRRVMLDCVAQSSSGAYMRGRQAGVTSSSSTKLRDVLHVQSRSYWAPVCVGPYSQVNTLRSILHFVAGQIGLVPETMTLRKTWPEQLKQAWRNLACVLDALQGSSLEQLLSGMVYISDSIVLTEERLEEIQRICNEQLSSNGGVAPNEIEGGQGDVYDGFEDRETMLELSTKTTDARSHTPLLLVSIPAMPVGALVEVEAIATTKAFDANTTISSSKRTVLLTPEPAISAFEWDTGHDFSSNHQIDGAEISILSGSGSSTDDSVVCTTVLACLPLSADNIDIDPAGIIKTMLSAIETEHVVSLRVYYLSKVVDGTTIRSACQQAIAAATKVSPAVSFVPVSDMHLLNMGESRGGLPLLAFQSHKINSLRAETTLWIHQKRG